jgi:hypothetical protein
MFETIIIVAAGAIVAIISFVILIASLLACGIIKACEFIAKQLGGNK